MIPAFQSSSFIVLGQRTGLEQPRHRQVDSAGDETGMENSIDGTRIGAKRRSVTFLAAIAQQGAVGRETKQQQMAAFVNEQVDDGNGATPYFRIN
jgi:hypothetical protein